MIQFDKVNHIYTVENKILPSVNQIINDVLGIEYFDSQVMRDACQRGTDVHHYTEQIDLGWIDIEEVPEEYQGYCEAWEKFKKKHNVRFEEVEQRHHYMKMFAGTPDRKGWITINDVEYKAVFDIKTGQINKNHGLQIGGYTLFYEPESLVSIAVKLNDNGTFEVYQFEDLSENFYSMFKVWEFKQMKKTRRRIL